MHAWERQHRTVPGQRLWEPGVVSRALWERDREPRTLKTVLQSTCQPRVVKEKRPGQMADAAPNSPLLKRVMRNPFALYPDRARRTSYREVIAAVRTERARFPRSSETIARERPAFPNPVRALDRANALNRPRPWRKR